MMLLLGGVSLRCHRGSLKTPSATETERGWGWRGGGLERIDADEYCGILSSCFPVPDTLNTRSREKQERKRERGIEREREEEKERQREKERTRGTLLYFSVSN